MAYLFNFKISIMMVSNFGALPRFGANYTPDNWAKFNIFSGLYIVLVYLPFALDFYEYFTQFGLRSLTSFVAIEAVGIMTIICIILLLEIIQQCNCIGMGSMDIGKRAGLIKDMKRKAKKGKRRTQRSGMGNDESSWEDEYDSENDAYMDVVDEEVAGEEEAESEQEEYYDEESDDSAVDPK